jgi:hypothetical protein
MQEDHPSKSESLDLSSAISGTSEKKDLPPYIKGLQRIAAENKGWIYFRKVHLEFQTPDWPNYDLKKNDSAPPA